MDGFIRVFQRIADVVPAVTFVEVAAGRPEMKLVIPGASRVADNMLLKFSRQPVSPGGFLFTGAAAARRPVQQAGDH